MASCILGVAAVNGPRAAVNWLWIDEILTAELIDKTLGALVEDRYAAGHSPLYFVLAKLWIFLVAGREGAAYPDEFLMRVPSMIAMGLAGGLLGTCAWRTWGAASGLLFCVLWTLHPIVARYSIDARPYALMMMFLAIGIWANTRLLGRDRIDPLDRAGKPTWIASTAAPILLAATIPLGAVAAIPMEFASIVAVYRQNNDAIRSAWRKRVIVVWPAIAAIVAILAPAVAAKSVHFGHHIPPLSLANIVFVAGQITAGATWPNSLIDVAPLAAAILVISLASIGLAVQRDTILRYMAVSLAVGFPALIIAFSMVKSLLIGRYFLPSFPGILLLAVAGYSGLRNRRIAVVVSVVLCLSMALALVEKRSRLGTVETEARFIRSIGIPAVIGASSNFLLKRSLNYYLPRRMGIESRVGDLGLPLDPAVIPESGVYWVFDWPPLKLTGSDFEQMPVTCEFKVGVGRIYAITRSADDLPDGIRKCSPPSD